MYRITARQILVIALGSALFASVAVLGFQKLSQRFYPSRASAHGCRIPRTSRIRRR